MMASAWRRAWPALLLALLTAAPLACAADTHGEQPNLLGGDIGNAIFTLIIFGLVIYILGKFAWPKVLSALNEREQFIRESLASAKHEREQAEALLAEYERRLAKAHAEATAIVEEGRRDADAARRRILDEARQETAEMTARARREIELATDAAIKTLYDRTSDFTLQVASRFLGKALSRDEHQRLVDEAIREIEANGHARMN